MNLIEGRVTEAGTGAATVATAIGEARVETAAARSLPARASMWAGGRESALVRHGEPIAGGRLVVEGTVAEIGYLGGATVVVLAASDGRRFRAVMANTTRRVERPLAVGETARLAVAPDALVVLTR